MRYALLLALLLPSLAFADGGYLMDQSSKDESLQILSELEANSSGLRQALQIAQDSSARLDEDLKLSLSKLDNSERLLREAKLNLESSEGSLVVVKSLLDQAQKALTDSEKSFKDYQRSDLLRLVAAGGASFAIGILTEWGLSTIF